MGPVTARTAWSALQKWRLTFFFVVTALLALAVAVILVNRVIGNQTEANLIRVAEENTARDAIHIQAMMRRHNSMHSMSPGGTATDTKPMGQPMMLTLESLTGPEGLDSTFPMLVEGLSLVKLNLFDLNGTTVWSTDPATIGVTKRESPLFGKAATGESSSNLVNDHEVVYLDGVVRSIDVVETYVPLRATRGGQVIGVMELYRDIADDVAVQVDDTKSMVLWTTLATMGALFMVLVGFVIVADVSILKSRRRELTIVEKANSTLEARVQERTQELEEAQEQLVRSEKLAAIGQLAGGVAHDLRNPLGAINNAVYYLKKRLGTSEIAQSNPRIGQFLQIVEEEVEHSNRIISDLMSFARVGVSSLSPTDLGEAVSNALSTMDIRDNVHVEKQLDPHLPQANGRHRAALPGVHQPG